ncbi:MAG: hypothetical protein KFKLKKLM_00449 [Flavobacteriales bacterium]|nr:hypothetical protein [Flavobacteriales bacterium]
MSDTLAVAAPSLPDLQVTLVVLVILNPNAAGSVMVIVESAEQPAASVTVTVTVPALRLFSNGVVFVDVLHA